jgi:hypothetical protein
MSTVALNDTIRRRTVLHCTLRRVSRCCGSHCSAQDAEPHGIIQRRAQACLTDPIQECRSPVRPMSDCEPVFVADSEFGGDSGCDRPQSILASVPSHTFWVGYPARVAIGRSTGQPPLTCVNGGHLRAGTPLYLRVTGVGLRKIACPGALIGWTRHVTHGHATQILRGCPRHPCTPPFI